MDKRLWSDDDNFWEMKRESKRIKDNRDIKRREDSKERLKKIIAKNFQTVMIGALSDIENAFGYIWGHEIENKTTKEEEREELWAEVRESILNRGNNKLRASLREIDNHDVNWNRYNKKFKLNNKWENDNEC